MHRPADCTPSVPSQANAKALSPPSRSPEVYTRILSEAPIFKIPRDVPSLQAAERNMIALNLISKDEQDAFFSLYNTHGSSYSPSLGIAKTNALPLGSGASEGGLFLEASRINHAYRPNAQNTWNANLEKITIHACRDIEQGEEITISYLDGSQGYNARQLSLKNSFAFTCGCELCCLPPAQRRRSDQRLDEITRLDNLIGDGVRIVSTPLACLRAAYALLGLLQEEGIADARKPRLYYDALQIAIANGDRARAKVFARRAHDARVVLEGNDSPEAIKMKGYADRPTDHRLYGTSMRSMEASCGQRSVRCK